MIVRDLRLRYELETSMGRKVCHAIVCNFQTIGGHIRECQRIGYPILGVDERYRDDNTFMELDEGWTEIAKCQREKEISKS